MSFNETNMRRYKQRTTAVMASLQNLREEAAKLLAIYFNEAGGGSDPAWDDVGGITEEEHVAAVTLFGDLEKFFSNEPVGTANRENTMTPFLQD
jgi:hypothetical protein